MTKFLDSAGVSHLVGKIKDGTIKVPASGISGVLSIDQLPQGALERLVKVSSKSAMLLLTKDDVQLGDTVQDTGTGVMYIVVDESKLSSDGKVSGSDDAFVEYTAGSATSVPFSGVTGKPTTLSGYGITDGVNKAEVSGTGNAVTGLSASGHTLTGTLGSFLQTLKIGDSSKTVDKNGSLSFTLAEIGAAVSDVIPTISGSEMDTFYEGVALFSESDDTTNIKSRGLVVAKTAGGVITQFLINGAGLSVRQKGGTSSSWSSYEVLTDVPNSVDLTEGLYKITTSGGRVTKGTAVAKSDITALGIPGDHSKTGLVVASSSTGSSTAAASSKNPYLNLFDDSTQRSSIHLQGSNGTTVVFDGTNLVISSPTCASGATADSALSDAEIDAAIASA